MMAPALEVAGQLQRFCQQVRGGEASPGRTPWAPGLQLASRRRRGSCHSTAASGAVQHVSSVATHPALTSEHVPFPPPAQCGSFHALSAFQGDFRSCTRQLARHAERRRRGRAAAAAARKGLSRQPTSQQQQASALEDTPAAAQPAYTAALPSVAAPTMAVPPSPLAGNAGAVAAAAAAAAAARQHDEGRAPLPSGQACSSGSSSLSSHSHSKRHAASPSAGLDALLAAAEEEEAAEQQRAAAKRRRAGDAVPTGEPARRRRTMGGAPDLSWFLPPLPALGKPASPIPDASAASSQSLQLKLPLAMGVQPGAAEQLAQLAQLQLAAAPLLAATAGPALKPLPASAVPASPTALQQAAAVTALAAALQLLQHQAALAVQAQPAVPLLPAELQEAIVAGLLQSATNQILVLSATQ